MPAACAHRESIAGTVATLGSLRGNRHGPFKNEQAGVEFMGVLGVQRICLHAPIDNLRIALLAQFGLENGPIHLLLLILAGV
jgi:hypothetical protein